jgi:hypothetical protein
MPSSLSYSCDSPFFAKRSRRCDSDLERLAEFMRTLTRQLRQFCRDAKTLSRSAEALSVHMKTGLGAAGSAALTPVMACFADIFAEIASSQEILAVRAVCCAVLCCVLVCCVIYHMTLIHILPPPLQQTTTTTTGVPEQLLRDAAGAVLQRGRGGCAQPADAVPRAAGPQRQHHI